MRSRTSPPPRAASAAASRLGAQLARASRSSASALAAAAGAAAASSGRQASTTAWRRMRAREELPNRGVARRVGIPSSSYPTSYLGRGHSHSRLSSLLLDFAAMTDASPLTTAQLKTAKAAKAKGSPDKRSPDKKKRVRGAAQRDWFGALMSLAVLAAAVGIAAASFSRRPAAQWLEKEYPTLAASRRRRRSARPGGRRRALRPRRLGALHSERRGVGRRGPRQLEGAAHRLVRGRQMTRVK